MRSHDEILSDARRISTQIQVVLTSRRKRERARRTQRTYQAEVLVSFGELSEGVTFRASQICPTGLFLHSRLLLEPGEELMVTFPTPQGRDELVARGHVVGVETAGSTVGPGMHITFYELAGAVEQLGVYAEAA